MQTKDVRYKNTMKILNTLIDLKTVSRAKITELTHLNKATVSSVVKELIDYNIIKETSIGESSGGRKPIMLTQIKDAGFCISLEIKVSNIRLVVTDLSNNIIKNEYIPLIMLNFDLGFKLLCDSIQSIITSMPKSKYGLIGIGISVQGVVDLDGIIRFILNPYWKNVDIKTLLENKFNVPVFIHNDGHLSAYTELKNNSHCKELVVLTIDDVISCGIISNGKIVKGFLGYANIVGHHTVNSTEKNLCSCGKKGCLEQYCSNIALINRYNSCSDTSIYTIYQFINLIDKNDKIALSVLDEYIDYLTIAISNLIFILNCEKIILNSIIFNSFPELVDKIKEKLVLPITKQQDICISKSGSNACVLGASHICIIDFYKSIFNNL